VRLAVLAPEILGDVPTHLPIYIQGLLNNNFNKYSAINLIDRQNLDRIISEQNMAVSGRFSDRDFVSIGNLTNALYYLFGNIQRISGERYAVELRITESSTGNIKASFMRNSSLIEIEGRGTLINAAAADLLGQMGVELTDVGRRMLLAGNTSEARAEAGMARGITAQADGNDVDALFNITQAITFDPSNIEAISRLDTLSSSISGGTVSQMILNKIQARNRWIEVFKETARFFNDHPPFEITFDPNLVELGLDYAKGTATIGMRVALDPLEAGFIALNALLEGLEKTGFREEWGFSGWPLLDLREKTTGTVVFGGNSSFNYKLDVALLNEKNKKVSNSSITLTTKTKKFSAGDKSVQSPAEAIGTVQFLNVRAADLTPTLTIVITAVNGIPSRDLSASGYMKIDTGDLEKRSKEWEASAQAAEAQREAEEAARLAQAQREKEMATARQRQQNQNTGRILGYILLLAAAAGGLVALIILAPSSNSSGPDKNYK
jgi:hypothetical protein